MRGAWLAMLLAAGTAAADVALVDPDLANGTTALDVSGNVGVTLEVEPTRALLELLERYHVPATFFVPFSYWDTPDPELLALVRRADARFGLLVEDDNRIANALANAARAGHRIGVFRTRRSVSSARLAALRAKLTQVAPSRANRSLARGGAIVRVEPLALAAALDDLERHNCERLARGERLVTPVALHYFVRDRDRPRAVPEHIQAQTSAFRDRLADDCVERAAPPRGEFPQSPRPRGDFAPCTANPLAKGCM